MELMSILVKLICGIIRATDCKVDKVMDTLTDEFGTIDFKSPTIPFDFTHYYNNEMGREHHSYMPLQREWISFNPHIRAEDLRSIKLTTIEIENKFRRPNNTRTVNLDPGYITLSNLVLASTKNYSHRIYLGDGIYAEVTLIYKNQHFQSLEWTYPDYQANVNIFEEIRDKLKRTRV